MILSDDAIDSFIEAYREDTGETLSQDEARDAAHRLLTLIELVAGDPPGYTEPPAPEDQSGVLRSDLMPTLLANALAEPFLHGWKFERRL